METKTCLPKVTFELVAGNTNFELEERFAFWDSPNTVSWFKTHGYTLYHRPDSDSPETFPALPFEPYQCAEVHYPYAQYDAESSSEDERLRSFDRTGKVAFAQDEFGRHVVIKLVRAETDEFRILQFLSKQSMDTLRENCVIPVLDLLPIDGFCFAVMPRWGSLIWYPAPRRLHEVVTVMHSILKNIKGLTFLHGNGIAHHDVMMQNVLVDHFTDMGPLILRNNTRAELRSNGRLLYALFDFDHSVLLPPGAKKGEFRLPYWRSWGTFNKTMDTASGEFDYDPFVLDVGLGVQFCDYFQHLTSRFPLLAPLLDMMTTHDLSRRFTAAKALQFLEEATSEFNRNYQLMHGVTILQTDSYYFEYDRWSDLPAEFVEKWKHYKETPVPWITLLLRRVCRRRYFAQGVRRIRWFLFSGPRALLSWLLPSQQPLLLV